MIVLVASIVVDSIAGGLWSTGEVASAGSAGAPDPTLTAASPDPIVFVHGFAFDGAQEFFRRDFLADGFTRLYGFSYRANDGTTPSNRVLARRLGAFVQRVLAQTGAAKVDLVAHSMGNHVARWCLAFDGCAGRVDDYVSLDGANHGTVWAEGCDLLYPRDHACPELRPGSAFLRTLNDGDETRGADSYTTVRSRADTVILPTSSAMLAGAHNRLVDGVDHWQVLSDRSVYRLVRDAVR